MHKQILKCCGKCHANYWCQYHAIERQGKLIIANLVHGWVAPLWDWHKASLVRYQCFTARTGFSEACRGRRM